MVNDKRLVEQHVGTMLSGFVDGELTQQERQRVAQHCEQCDACRQELAEIRTLQQRISNAHLSEVGKDQWRETMQDMTVQTSRSIGWLLFSTGILAATGVGLYQFITEPGLPNWLKLTLLAIYGGLIVLLFSVLRQRLIERKSDKYKDVEI